MLIRAMSALLGKYLTRSTKYMTVDTVMLLNFNSVFIPPGAGSDTNITENRTAKQNIFVSIVKRASMNVSAGREQQDV